MKIFKTWIFRWWEVSLLKICLISCGILIGLYFSAEVIDLLALWWLLFLVPAAYFIKRIFR